MKVLSIVIPAYNEEKTIVPLLERVLAVDLAPYGKEIIVVNDGSRDTTESAAKTLREKVIVISHDQNRGKGAAVRTGFQRATGDFVVVQDADLEYDPNDFKEMIRVAEKHNARVVYGSRILPLADGSRQRGRLDFYLGGVLLTFITNLLYGTRITDEPTCYKMIRRDFLNEIPLTANGFEFCPEITAHIAKRNVQIYEVPIRYSPRTTKEGKKIKLRDWFVAVWTLLKHRF